MAEDLKALAYRLAAEGKNTDEIKSALLAAKQQVDTSEPAAPYKQPSYGEDVLSAGKGIALGLGATVATPFAGLRDLLTGKLSEARDANKESTASFFANALPNFPKALLDMLVKEPAAAVQRILTEGNAEQAGELMGVLMGAALPAGKKVPSAILPTSVQAAAKVPEKLARATKAGVLELMPQKFTRAGTAFVEGYKGPPPEESLPTIGRTSEPLGGPNVVGPAREPQPLSAFGTLLDPDAMSPADVAANMKSAQLLKSLKPSSIAELLEAQAAPESLTLQSGAPIATEELLQLIESLRQGRH